MNFVNYVDDLRDELSDSEKYIKMAIENKTTHSGWAAIYAKMSEEELSHARNIVDIFEDELKTVESDDPVYDDLYDSILDMYTDQCTRVKLMHKAYAEK